MEDAHVGHAPFSPLDSRPGGPLRIAYVVNWFLFDGDGVARKIEAQAARWRSAGHEVEVFCLARVFPSRQRTEPPWRILYFDGMAARLRQTARLARSVRAWRPDVAYLRNDLFVPPLRGLVRAVPTVLEVNSSDAELRLRRRAPALASIYGVLNRRTLYDGAAGFVFLTEELRAAGPQGPPAEVIPNCIDLAAFRPLPPAPAERPAAAFLGSMRQPWHGVDKLLRLAERLPDVDFHLIGYHARNLDEDGFPAAAVSANVTAHGVLPRERYEPVLARCDAAFGTLALHRKHMEEACPLKVREYLAYGLPTVIGYRDTDLAGVDAWYLLRLPNSERNVDEGAARIRAFLDDARGRRVPREDVAARIDAGPKEERRLALLERAARGAFASAHERR